MSTARWMLAAALVALGGCASQGSVRQLQTDVGILTAETARRDSVLGAQISQLADIQRRIMDSLAATRAGIASLRGNVSNDLYSVQQQLQQLQEATGQSQQRLSELRTQLETTQSAPPAGAPGDTSARAGAAAPGTPTADQMYQASLTQLRRGSTSTARAGLQELLRQYPASERAPDALYYIGESFTAENADSAARYYQDVAANYPQSPRASGALYKLGLLAERKKDTAAARDLFNRVVQKYPRSDEAALARERLKALGGR